ncbi:MAG: 4a-hydroxytetrahydrobiopterin dehydratase [Blastocatellia bacterium]|nr:4a-hydroxytetrahydrobiopterin dehydratase [Blastocatellia bacterium]
MRLSEEQIHTHLAARPGWRREGEEIVRDFKFANFQQAMAFVNRVADAAEAVDHHPDILIHGWNNVRLRVMTHDKGGLTPKDFDLAARIEPLFQTD